MVNQRWESGWRVTSCCERYVVSQFTQPGTATLRDGRDANHTAVSATLSRSSRSRGRLRYETVARYKTVARYETVASLRKL